MKFPHLPVHPERLSVSRKDPCPIRDRFQPGFRVFFICVPISSRQPRNDPVPRKKIVPAKDTSVISDHHTPGGMPRKRDQLQLPCCKFATDPVRKCQIRLPALKRRIMYKFLFPAFKVQKCLHHAGHISRLVPDSRAAGLRCRHCHRICPPEFI